MVASVAGPTGVMARVSEIQDLVAAVRGAAAPAGSAVGFAQAQAKVQSTSLGAGSLSSSSLAASSPGPAAVGGATGGAPVGGGATAPSGVDVERFANDVLSGLGVPRSAENVRALRAWVSAEGTSARFNPLATTQPMPGATAFNSVGVRNFTSYDQGLAATLKTLKNGHYGPILSALGRGDDAMAVAGAIEASPWGTGGLVREILSREAR